MAASVSHDVVIVTACSRAACAPAVPREHLGTGPAVELHEVALGPAVVQTGREQCSNHPERVGLRAGGCRSCPRCAFERCLRCIMPSPLATGSDDASRHQMQPAGDIPGQGCCTALRCAESRRRAARCTAGRRYSRDLLNDASDAIPLTSQLWLNVCRNLCGLTSTPASRPRRSIIW